MLSCEDFSKRDFIYRRVWAIIKLIVLFMKELILANVQVFKLVLTRNNVKPAIFAMPTVAEQDWEITLLSSLITLTPGTVVVHMSDDSKTLYIHAIDMDDVDEASRFYKKFV